VAFILFIELYFLTIISGSYTRGNDAF